VSAPVPNPFPSREVRRLVRELGWMRRRIDALEGGAAASGAGYSSLDGGQWIVKDAEGVVRQVIGNQGDGSVTTADINAPAPPTPTDPVLTAIPGGFRVGYSGSFVGGAARPRDLAWVEVHIDLDPLFEVSDATVDAALTGTGTVTFATRDYVPHTVRLVAVNTSHKRSAPSGAYTITPGQIGTGDVAPGGIGTVSLEDGAVTPPKSGTGVTSNLVPDPGFNDAGWRAKRTAPPWGFVDASSMGFTDADWAAYCNATTTRAALTATGDAGVPVIPGETYFIAYDVARSSSGAGRCWLEVTFTNSAGVVIATSTTEDGIDPLLIAVRDIGSLPTGDFDTRDGQVAVPPLAAAMRIVFVRQDLAGTSAGTLFVDRLEVRSIISRSNTGARVETSPSGVLVFGANGQPLGSITPDGSLSMVTGSFDQSMSYQGTELADWLNQRARGEVARVDLGAGPFPHTATQIDWFEINFTAYSGRSYKLRSSGLIARNPGHRGLVSYWTTDGTRPLLSSPQFVYNDVVQDTTLYLASDLGWSDGQDRQVRMLFAVKAWTGVATDVYFDPCDIASGFSVWAEDVGPRAESSGGAVSGPVIQTFVESLNCTWSQSWQAADVIRQVSGLMWQGFYDNVQGDQVGIFSFDLRGLRTRMGLDAVVKKLEIYLYAEHWYWNTGGNVWLGTSSVLDPPAHYPDTWSRRAAWHLGKPEGKWVDIDWAGANMFPLSGLADTTGGMTGRNIGYEIQHGTLGSFVLEPRPWARNLTDYGRFIGSGGGQGSAAPGLRITYEKPI
jgi:hypothetical protein